MAAENLPCIIDVHDLRGKRVIVRASLNVPLESGKVANDYRIKEALPTLEFLRDAGARIIVLAHIGRDPKLTLEPVYEVLKKHIELSYLPKLTGDAVVAAASGLGEGEILLLENVRSDERETENDPDFGAVLASYGELYINDAFPDSHRAHASIVGVPGHLQSYAGITFKREFDELKKATSPQSPSLFILGGAKFETKEKLIEKFSETYDHVFIGGALANDFLKVHGYEVGTSLVSDMSLAGNPLTKKKNILLPTDVVVDGPQGKRTVSVRDVEAEEAILDVGSMTMSVLDGHIKEAKNILWNGPLGNYEGGYREATETCAKLIAESHAHSVVGGGDTVAAIESLGVKEKFGFLSSAGGAMLTFLETETLPGIEAILDSNKSE